MGNIVIRRPGSGGGEAAPPVIVQGALLGQLGWLGCGGCGSSADELLGQLGWLGCGGTGVAAALMSDCCWAGWGGVGRVWQQR